MSNIKEWYLNLLSDNRLAVGIDLGASRCIFSRFQNGRVFSMYEPQVMCVNYHPNYDTPTAGECFGNEREYPEKNRIFDWKRFLGKQFHDPYVQNIHNDYVFDIKSDNRGNVVFPLKYDGYPTDITPEDVATEILKKSPKYLTRNLHTVVSVPYHFTIAQRTLIQQAVEKAGFVKHQLIEEPIAAALQFYYDKEPKEGLTLIINFGDYFDVSVVEVNGNNIHVKCYEHNELLGANLVARNIIKHLCERYPDTDEDWKKHIFFKVLNNLYSNDQYPNPNSLTDTWMDKVKSMCMNDEQAIRQVLRPCLELTKKCLERNNLSTNDITNVVCVGYLSIYMEVEKMVEDIFGRIKVFRYEPQYAVAKGAALYASRLMHGGNEIPNRYSKPEQEHINQEQDRPNKIKVNSQPAEAKDNCQKEDKAIQTDEIVTLGNENATAIDLDRYNLLIRENALQQDKIAWMEKKMAELLENK